MNSQEQTVWNGTYYEIWNPLMEDPVDTRMEEAWDSPERQWAQMQYTRRDMSGVPVTNLSSGQYYSSVHNTSGMYHYGTSASYSASPPSHNITPVTPSINISRPLPQTISTSPTTYHRSNSSVSPLEPASPFSNSLPDSSPMSRSSTNNLPVVEGHGLSFYDGSTLKCYCGTEFRGAKAKNTWSNFKRHLKTKGTQIPCPQCDKVFNRQDNVQQHIRTRHVRR